MNGRTSPFCSTTFLNCSAFAKVVCTRMAPWASRGTRPALSRAVAASSAPTETRWLSRPLGTASAGKSNCTTRASQSCPRSSVLAASSPQLDRPERGFSFRLNGPLDMRMDPSTGESAADWLARVDQAELESVLWKYGEERHGRRVARAILARRADEEEEPLRTTRQLAELVAKVVPSEGRIHPATRTFQGIRIAINDELGELERALDAFPQCLAPGGRLVVISFHSLEDRAVKACFRRLVGDGGPRDLYGNPVSSSAFRLVERRARKGDSDPNPRARSARLRALERLP